MSNDGWLSGVRQFKFGKAGNNPKMEYFFAGALALIIILALFLTIKYSFFKDSGSNLPDELHFKCLNPACGAEALLKSKDVNLEEVDTQRPQCPQCGKKSLVIEQQCPLCKAYFVNPRLLNPRAPMQSGDQMCPKCNGNITDYYRQMVK